MSDTLWVARHAPVAVEGICYGRADVPVCGTGAEAAASLARSFPPRAPHYVVWSSSTARCRDVACDLSSLWSAELRVDDLLCELDFGTWEGRRWSDIAWSERDAYESWMREWRTVGPPGGECPLDLERRARRWIDRLDARRSHALVAHAGFVRALRVLLAGLDWQTAMQSEVQHLRWQPMAFDVRGVP